MSPTTPMAKLVATRASCLSDFTFSDTSPSAKRFKGNHLFLENGWKETVRACTVVPNTHGGPVILIRKSGQLKMRDVPKSHLARVISVNWPGSLSQSNVGMFHERESHPG